MYLNKIRHTEVNTKLDHLKKVEIISKKGLTANNKHN